MRIQDVIEFLETLAPPALQESYDNAGLIVGNGQTELKGIMVSLDCTEDVVDDAVAQGCNLIVSHHPIVFSGIKKLNGKNYIERTVIKAIQRNVALYAIHTNLDNVKSGVNRKIAERIGLENLRILAPKDRLLKKVVTYCPVSHADAVRMAMFSAGAGHIGNYDQCSFNTEGTGTFRAGPGADPYVGEIGKQQKEQEVRIETVVPGHVLKAVLRAMRMAHPYEEVAFDVYAMENVWPDVGSGMIGDLPKPQDALEFLHSLKTIMQTDCVRYTLPHCQEVKRVALCGGSGSFLLPNAIDAHADVFITADFKYHQFFDADDRIIIADIGHYESEQFTMELLASELDKKFPNFAARLTRVRTNPVNYL